MPGARPRPWVARMHPSAHPRSRLAVREAHLDAAPRASSSAPSRRCADSHARRTRHLRANCPRKAPTGPRAPHPRPASTGVPRVDRRQASPCNNATCNAAHRPQGKSSPTDKGTFFLVTGVPSRSWSTPAPGDASTPNWCAAPHATAVAVLCCCTRGSGFRIMSLTCGAKGTRTPGLLHAISRQHVHPCLSPQVTVPQRAPGSAGVRAGCCTFLLYFSAVLPGRSTATQRRCSTPARQRCPHQRPRMVTYDQRLLACFGSYSLPN